MITGGQCKFSSSVQIKSSDRSFPSFYFCYCTNKQMFNIPFCLINASVVFMIFFCFFSTCVFPDVPEVVYSCHTEAATGSRPSLPAAWNGRRVCPTRISILK